MTYVVAVAQVVEHLENGRLMVRLQLGKILTSCLEESAWVNEQVV